MERTEVIGGAILGCAVGDALGLPYEGLSRRRATKLLGPPDRYRFFFGRGMVSDDTEHTCMVAQALCEAPTDAVAFSRSLARRMRWWLLGLPAGIGWATLQATLKLWVGIPPSRSGVFSAGNGPAMRSAVLGALIDDLAALGDFVRASTRITHVDPKAYEGALAVAVAAWCAKRQWDEPTAFFSHFRTAAGADLSKEFEAILARVELSLTAGESTVSLAEQLGCVQKVSGYVYHSVPVALHAWLRDPRDFSRAVASAIQCGGDADTTAAMVGAIVGCSVGRNGIPAVWLARLCEWPRSVNWMERLAIATSDAVAHAQPVRPPWVFPFAVLARNLFFLAVVFAHIGRRMLPPY